MARVLIALKYVPQYRAPFLERLRPRLAEEGVTLDLVYGDPDHIDGPKGDKAIIGWAKHLPSRNIRIGGTCFVYQPIARLAQSYDLVIVEQATRLLANLPLILLNGLGLVRMAYWGHGKSFQGGDGALAAKVKKLLVSRVHWWFAYNKTAAAVVREAEFPDDRITLVMNTIDNESLVKNLGDVTDREVEEQRRALGLRGDNVCIFVGSMYDQKKIPFLLEVCERIRAQVPDFEMVFLGGGPDKALVDAFAAAHNWAVSCGPTFARDKAAKLKLAKLFLMPGLVGLAVIDCFAAEVPIVTTNYPYHSPEIEYLVNGVNGVMLDNPDDVDAYVAAVVEILKNRNLLESLRAGCREAAKKYSLRAMVDNFAGGVMRALNAQPRRRGVPAHDLRRDDAAAPAQVKHEA